MTSIPPAVVPPPYRYILGLRIDATSYDRATRQILVWSHEDRSRRVYCANVHMVMEACRDLDFQRLLNGADLVTPDGMPLMWALRLLKVQISDRVYGPTLTLHVCEAAAAQGVPIALYGGTPDSLRAFVRALEGWFPEIEIACSIAPPFRPLTSEEDRRYTEQIRASGARILFVGLGCPKQERWIADHQERISAVMLGVGAAFDFHSGRVRQAPSWMQNAGLEWVFRLMMEPRRLWKRYLLNNPVFVARFASQLVRTRWSGE